MDMPTMESVSLFLEAMAVVFWLVIGFAALAVVVLFVLDRIQTSDAIRRNYPVLGRFRGLFSTLGEFFRQYFFAMDREELPFNRAQREWVKHSGEGKSSTLPFGSTRNISVVGTPLFMPSAFPPLDNQFASSEPLQIGPYCDTPYMAGSFFNLSGMSYGAISAPAVRALSRGAQMAGMWMNTGEGGLSPYHLEGGCDVVFQIGTAKFGVRDKDGALDEGKLADIAAKPQVTMFEIKLSQGAKPGKGGILPAAKITDEIAEIRGLPKGRDGISPNRHKEAEQYGGVAGPDRSRPAGHGQAGGHQDGDGRSAGCLADLFAAVNARGAQSAPDFITLDGGEGGTGAAPMPLMDLVGMSIREALADPDGCAQPRRVEGPHPDRGQR